MPSIDCKTRYMNNNQGGSNHRIHFQVSQSSLEGCSYFVLVKYCYLILASYKLYPPNSQPARAGWEDPSASGNPVRVFITNWCKEFGQHYV